MGKTSIWHEITPEDFLNKTLAYNGAMCDAFFMGTWLAPEDKFHAGDLAIYFKPNGKKVYCRIIEVYRHNRAMRCRIKPIHLDLMFSAINPALMYNVNEDCLHLIKKANGKLLK